MIPRQFLRVHDLVFPRAYPWVLSLPGHIVQTLCFVIRGGDVSYLSHFRQPRLFPHLGYLAPLYLFFSSWLLCFVFAVAIRDDH